MKPSAKIILILVPMILSLLIFGGTGRTAHSSLGTVSQAPNAPFFEDGFNGTSIDATKWNSTYATSGLRWCSSTVANHHENPGVWLDPSATACQGAKQNAPYGNVAVGAGSATFSSLSNQAFPYIWAGQPSKHSPFPSNGNFILKIRLAYDIITGEGTGIFVTNWNDTTPAGNNPPGHNRVLMIWNDGQNPIVQLLGNQSQTLVGFTGTHDYELQYLDGTYSLHVDGQPLLGPAPSSVRPNTIWIGNPVIAYWHGPVNWSKFTLNMIQVTVAVSPSPVLVENFNNNMFDNAYWQAVQVGTGASTAVTNHRLEISIAANASDDKTVSLFGAGLTSTCTVHGDFDMRVKFQLLIWPSATGVRTGLGSSFLMGGIGSSPVLRIPFAVERDSFGLHDGSPREVYLTDLMDGVQGIRTTLDLQGTLRMVRTGTEASGYFYNGATWTLVHTGPSPSVDVGFGFASWSHDSLFSHQNTKMAFSNFTLNSGRLVCPRLAVTPSSGPVGTKVNVHGSGFPAPDFPLTGLSTVSVTFDDMFLGTTAVNGDRFDFTLDVPDAQVGLHQIKAVDFLTQTKASAEFHVTVSRTGTTGGLSVALSSGTIYFPGDTAVATILTTVSGSPTTSSDTTLKITLYTPQNKTVQLSTTPLGQGLTKASYTIPASSSTGTYTIVVAAHSDNNGDASVITSFEVKPSWLQQNSGAITAGGIASLGALGTAIVIWRKGLIGRKSPDPI